MHFNNSMMRMKGIECNVLGMQVCSPVPGQLHEARQLGMIRMTHSVLSLSLSLSKLACSLTLVFWSF